MLQRLPEELLGLCWLHCGLSALRALRLSSRSISPSATKRLFRHVTLLPSEESADKCAKLMAHEELRLMVLEMSFHTSENPTSDEQDGVDETRELPEEYEQCCYNVHKFRNLRSVNIRFSPKCASPDNDYSIICIQSVDEPVEFRRAVMTMILDGLDDDDHPITGLKELSIDNLQDMAMATSTSASFAAVLSKLSTLALHIATESEEASPENSITKPELHEFFNKDLSRLWLQPLQSQLTNLTLYADNYWGYFPSCPLEDLHFPHLQSLALGNYTFTHDSQLDWIFTHGQTLQALSLDDCPILHHCTMSCGFKDNRIARTREDFQNVWDSEDDTWKYEARWYKYFERMQTGLPKLKNFTIGSGEWNLWQNRDGAMASRHLLKPELVITRYVAFEGGTGPSQWIEPRTRSRYGQSTESRTDVEYDGCWDDEEMPQYPDCDGEDRLALEILLEVIRKR